MHIRSVLVAVAIAIAVSASAQVRANPYDNGADPFPNRGRIDAPALSTTTRSAVQAEFIRARKAGEISAYDNRAEAFKMADLMTKPAEQRPAVAQQ